MADVSGYGVAAALVASMVKIAFAAEAERLDAPGLAPAHINRTLCGSFQGAYVTAWCGVLDAINRRLIYSNAGHPAPLLRRWVGQDTPLQDDLTLVVVDVFAREGAAHCRRCGDKEADVPGPCPFQEAAGSTSRTPTATSSSCGRMRKNGLDACSMDIVMRMRDHR